jgi:hypothetical protein
MGERTGVPSVQRSAPSASPAEREMDGSAAPPVVLPDPRTCASPALPVEMAGHAGMEACEVSLDPLVRLTPGWLSRGLTPRSSAVRFGRELGVIRPSARSRVAVPWSDPCAPRSPTSENGPCFFPNQRDRTQETWLRPPQSWHTPCVGVGGPEQIARHCSCWRQRGGGRGASGPTRAGDRQPGASIGAGWS